MELEKRTQSRDATMTTTAEHEPKVINDANPKSPAEKSENARNSTHILTPPTILETACSPENQRHRRKFSSLISQEEQQQQQQQQFFVRQSSGSIRTPSRLTVQKRPSSSAVYSPRASSSGPFSHHPTAPSPAVSIAVSPLYPTSDLGSSPRSSLSAITTAGPSSASSSVTDGGRFFFSKEMTPQEAAAAAIFSPGMLYSPSAPFSPFVVSPNEDAVFQSPTVFRFEAQKMTQQRPYFSFDPKSPSFLLHSLSTSYGSKHSGAILQEQSSALSADDQKESEISSTTLLGDRERSRSDSDVVNLGGQKSKFADSSIQKRSNIPSLCSLTPSAAVQKKIFKKQILERYQTEIIPDDSVTAACGVSSSSCSPLLAQLSFFPHFSNATAAALIGDNAKTTQDANFADLLLPTRNVEVESQAVKTAQAKTLEQCSMLEFMLKNPLFASLAFRQDSTVSSSPSSTSSSSTLSPFWAATVDRNALSSSLVSIFNRAPCLTLPTTPVALKIDELPSVDDNSINKRSRSESDMSQKSPLAFRPMATGKTSSSIADESQGSSTTTKSHKCAVCQKAFGRSDMLTRHMRLHTGIKPYACRVCGQVFSRSDHLSTHQRTHTGEKPYHCPQCTYSASRRDMITRHMRTHLRPRLGASTSSSSIGGGNTSSAPSASFDSANSGCATRLLEYSPKIDFDFSREFQHVSVIRRINSAKDFCDSEDITGLIHIEEMRTAEDVKPNSVEPSPAKNAQTSTVENLNFSSIDRPTGINLSDTNSDAFYSVFPTSEISTGETSDSCHSLYKRRFLEESEKVEESAVCSTAGGQSGVNIFVEKPTTSDDLTRAVRPAEHTRIKNEPE